MSVETPSTSRFRTAAGTVQVTDAELAVLRQLWRHGEAPIRHLVDQLYPDGGVSAHATVQKLLQRLETKGCVSRRRQGRANLYRPEVTRSTLIQRRLQDVADTFCDGALSPLLSHLVGSRRLSVGEIDQLRQLVDRLEGGAESIAGGDVAGGDVAGGDGDLDDDSGALP